MGERRSNEPGSLTSQSKTKKEHMKKTKQLITMTTLAGLAVLWGAGMAKAQQPGPSDTGPRRGQLSESDYRFVVKAARGGMEEVQLGQLAEQKAANPTVREFGHRMVTDHSKANEGLQQIASQKGASLPPTLSRTGRSTMEDLQQLSGYEFDKKYSKDMVKDHKDDIHEFERAAKDVTDPQLRAWVQQTLPILQEHLQMAEQMEASVKNQKQ